MILCVIPARGGSKRIPRKNIKQFYGKPIIAWSILAAARSGCFDRIIVSTDDEEIAKVAITYGAEIPFIRPKYLSDDVTGTVPVISHAVRWFGENGDDVHQACCIYPTSPFVSAADIRRGLEVLRATDADYAFSVTKYAFAIQRAIRITTEGRVEMFDPSHYLTRTQDLEQAWHDAGQFYWGRGEAWLSEKLIFGCDAAPVPLPRYRVQDIDTMEDWREAELMFKTLIESRELTHDV